MLEFKQLLNSQSHQSLSRSVNSNSTALSKLGKAAPSFAQMRPSTYVMGPSGEKDAPPERTVSLVRACRRRTKKKPHTHTHRKTQTVLDPSECRSHQSSANAPRSHSGVAFLRAMKACLNRACLSTGTKLELPATLRSSCLKMLKCCIHQSHVCWV